MVSFAWPGVLLDLGIEDSYSVAENLDQFVVSLDERVHGKMDDFMKKVRENPHTLFVLIHDDSHVDLTR